MAGKVEQVTATIQGWNYGSYGIWALVLQLAILLGVVVRNGPKWLETMAANKRMAIEDVRETDRIKAGEEAALEQRIDRLEERLSRMGQALTFLMSASTNALNALEVHEPGSIAVRQGRELIGFAASALGAEDPFSKALAKLAGVPGVGE